MKSPKHILNGIGRIREMPDWHMKNHAHTYYEVIVVFRGKMTVRINHTEYSAGQGNVLVYPPNVYHEEWSNPDDPVETLFMSFHWPDAPEIETNLFHDSGGRIHSMITWIYEERWSGTNNSGRIINALILSVQAELEKIASGVAEPLAAEAQAFMRENITEPLSLEILAENADLSKYHFLRKYKDATGGTPMQDLRRMRLIYARDLIVTTDLPLKAIAPKVGLLDEYQLSKYFRKYLNITPASLRRSS
mgnify:CR=1 FL=1